MEPEAKKAFVLAHDLIKDIVHSKTKASFSNDTVLLDKCYEVANYLAGGPDSIAPGLRDLNVRLEEALLERSDGMKKRTPQADDEQREAKSSDEELHVRGRVLHDVLLAFERSKNFVDEEPKRPIPKLIGFLQPEAFGTLLEQRRHFKDVGASNAHGEFTHRIQWFLIGSQNVITDPAGFFAQMAEYGANPGSFDGLWDALFDRVLDLERGFHSRPGPKDFRRPENLHALYLVTKRAEEFKTLHKILATRYRKREEELPNNNNSSRTQRYLARHLFKTAFEKLTKEQLEVVEQYSKKGMLEDRIEV